MAVTKAWKLYTPSISKRAKSVCYDWSNDKDGIRLMSVYCADLTGHPTYITLCITRNTERECDEEFEGQIIDGYFESYRGDIKGRTFPASKLRLDAKCVRNCLTQMIDTHCVELNTFRAIASHMSIDISAVSSKLKVADPLKVSQICKDILELTPQEGTF